MRGALQAPLIPRLDPSRGRELYLLDRPPGILAMGLPLLEAVHILDQRVVVNCGLLAAPIVWCTSPPSRRRMRSSSPADDCARQL
jgi:hypothetical protein